MIPKIIKIYIDNGYDGYVTDGIYTVFNFDKLNKYLIKDVDSIIYSLQQNENRNHKSKTIYITEAQFNMLK